MNKIGQYFNTFDITRGLSVSFLLSAFIYLHHFSLSYPVLNTALGVLGLSVLLYSERKTWFWSGLFTGIFWFWWIILSFQHYQMLWAMPIGLFFIALVYGIIFWSIACLSEKPASLLTPRSSLLTLTLKSIGLLSVSYLHPFGFDWFKPELLFVESYIGIEKWQFGIVLSAIVLTLWQNRLYYLLLVLLAYHPQPKPILFHDQDIQIVSTSIPVEEKWKETLHSEHFHTFFAKIDEAIEANKKLVILPESVFPVFINRSGELIDTLQTYAKKINIVTGGLYADGSIPRNSTYIFSGNRILVANKAVLVPFGESNPLPDFLSDWVNEVFYDGAVDYIASTGVSDYTIEGKTYRNAICFEATSEMLYKDKPDHMVVLSNNGWFTPSIEPTLQKLLLLYYNKKYGTTIYHSVNMSDSYIIKEGNVIK
ncbi:MAG: apolipoprotein N-acyltransferase [Sulfurimonas sp.]